MFQTQNPSFLAPKATHPMRNIIITAWYIIHSSYIHICNISMCVCLIEYVKKDKIYIHILRYYLHISAIE